MTFQEASAQPMAVTAFCQGMVRVGVEFHTEEAAACSVVVQRVGGKIDSYGYHWADLEAVIGERASELLSGTVPLYAAAAATLACRQAGYTGRLMYARLPDQPYTPYGCLRPDEMHDPDGPALFIGIDA